MCVWAPATAGNRPDTFRALMARKSGFGSVVFAVVCVSFGPHRMRTMQTIAIVVPGVSQPVFPSRGFAVQKRPE